MSEFRNSISILGPKIAKIPIFSPFSKISILYKFILFSF